MQLVKGRPEGLEDRQEKEIRVYKLLDRLQIEYDRITSYNVCYTKLLRQGQYF